MQLTPSYAATPRESTQPPAASGLRLGKVRYPVFQSPYIRLCRMADKDMALAILQAAIAIAGLVLVYSGFVLAKAGGMENTRKAKKFENLAKGALIPVIPALFCSWMGIRVLLSGHFASLWASKWLLGTFEIVLVLTGGYAIIAAIYGT